MTTGTRVHEGECFCYLCTRVTSAPKASAKDDGRETFEQVWNRLKYAGPEHDIYEDSHQQAGWEMWQAAQQHQDVDKMYRQMHQEFAQREWDLRKSLREEYEAQEHQKPRIKEQDEMIVSMQQTNAALVKKLQEKESQKMAQDDMRTLLEFAKLFAIKHCNDPQSVKLIQMIDAVHAQQHQEPRKASGWLPIESAPKDGKEFLVTFPWQGNVTIIANWNTVHKHWQTKGKPTGLAGGFWQPLPAPPVHTKGDK